MLSKVNDFGCEEISGQYYIPVDIDVSVLDNSNSNKESVGWTYKKLDGYAPIFAHVGAHGYTLANELRPGKQHSQKDAVEFLERSLQMSKEIGIPSERTLVRVDSAHDDISFIKTLLENNVKFIVKRNPRKDPPQRYLDMAKSFGEKIDSREGKNVYRFTISHIRPKGLPEHFPLFMVVEVTERLTSADGQLLLMPETEVDSWWSNLSCNSGTCINLYHDHATSEQYHAELKSDMGIERLPSGKFSTNNLFLRLSSIAFNLLRNIGQRALAMPQYPAGSKAVSRKRLRLVIRDLIRIAGKFVRHANRTFIKFGKHCPWFNIVQELYATG